jgi:hypothetical protein
MAFTAAVMLAVVLVYWGGDRRLMGLFLFVTILLSYLFGNIFLSGFRRVTHVDVGRDGQITVHGRRASHVLHRGEAKWASTVQVDFDEKTALAKWKLIPGEESKLSFDSFGDRDIQILKEFCSATGIVFKTTRPEEAEKGAFVPIDERRAKNRALGILFTFLIGLFAGLGVLMARCHATDEGPDPFVNKSLKGTFHSTNKELGEWTLTPSACLSGRDRGFEGIAFLFPAGGPVEEIRVDTARQGDNVVEVRLADRKGTVTRFRERECQVMSGAIEQANIEIGRPMVHLKGNTRFSCPAQGLSGDAEFDGCLPR